MTGMNCAACASGIIIAVALTAPLFAQMFTMFDFGHLGHSLRGAYDDWLQRWIP